jgi:hypothetical protein
MLGGFFSWAMPIILGAFGAIIAWVGLEFIGKPVRAFFDLKRDSLETLTLYANVRARSKQLVMKDNGVMSSNVMPLESAEEKRLQEAEAAFRLCGCKLHAFARTEGLAVVALRRLEFEPAKAGQGFVGLSNAVGEYGQARNDNRILIERSLKATD